MFLGLKKQKKILKTIEVLGFKFYCFIFIYLN